MWKEKVKFDIVSGDDLNWVEYLSEYQKLYNESPHSSLGFLTPFEVYFGRPPNRMDFEVQDENEEAFPQVDEILREEDLRELENNRFLLRQKALNASNNAAQKMVKRELKRHPPSLYFIGETVLVRIPTSKKTVKAP